MTALSELRQAIGAFEAAQEKFKHYGAADTEPCTIFQRTLAEAVRSKSAADVDLPCDGDDWDLFTHEMDCTPAARALTKAARRCVKLIVSWPGDRRKLRTFLQDYCWRASL